MKKITKEDIKQEVFDLYDDYAHNKIERRQFIERLVLICNWRTHSAVIAQFFEP